MFPADTILIFRIFEENAIRSNEKRPRHKAATEVQGGNVQKINPLGHVSCETNATGHFMDTPNFASNN